MIELRKMYLTLKKLTVIKLPGYVRRGIKVVLLSSLAVEANGQEIAFEFFHHQLEVVVI